MCIESHSNYERELNITFACCTMYIDIFKVKKKILLIKLPKCMSLSFFDIQKMMTSGKENMIFLLGAYLYVSISKLKHGIQLSTYIT